MTSQEKAINLGYLILTYKTEKKTSIQLLSSASIGMLQFFRKLFLTPIHVPY